VTTYDIFARSSGAEGPRWLTNKQGVLEGTSGSYVLSNIVMRMLFTTKGSIPTSRNEGTYLPDMVGNITDLDHARAIAIAAVADVESFIKKSQLRNPTANDETLSKLVINSVFLGEGPSLVLRILIYSAADSVIPLEVTV